MVAWLLPNQTTCKQREKAAATCGCADRGRNDGGRGRRFRRQEKRLPWLCRRRRRQRRRRVQESAGVAQEHLPWPAQCLSQAAMRDVRSVAVPGRGRPSSAWLFGDAQEGQGWRRFKLLQATPGIDASSLDRWRRRPLLTTLQHSPSLSARLPSPQRLEGAKPSIAVHWPPWTAICRHRGQSVSAKPASPHLPGLRARGPP